MLARNSCQAYLKIKIDNEKIINSDISFDNYLLC